MAQHILIVDDEPSVRRIVQVNLERAGYRVSMASHGVEALEKVQADRPDLVLLDVVMPHMDGFETLRRLKADPQTAAIPVVMASAQFKDGHTFESQRMGAELYLNKPFSPMELLQMVKEALSRGEEAKG